MNLGFLARTGRYFVGTILIIGGVTLIGLGYTNEGLTAIFAGLGLLGISYQQDRIEREVRIIKARIQ